MSSPTPAFDLSQHQGLFQRVSPRFQSTGSIVIVHGFSCSVACGIFLDQGSNLYLLHQQVDSLPLNHLGNLQILCFYLLSVLLNFLFFFVLFFFLEKHILLHLSYKKIKFLSESSHRHNPFKGCFLFVFFSAGVGWAAPKKTQE